MAKTDPLLVTWVAVSFASFQLWVMIEDALVARRASCFRASCRADSTLLLYTYTAITPVLSAMLPVIFLLSLVPEKLTGTSIWGNLVNFIVVVMAKLGFAAAEEKVVSSILYKLLYLGLAIPQFQLSSAGKHHIAPPSTCHC